MTKFVKPNSNHNCLVGMSCPQCFQHKSLVIETEGSMVDDWGEIVGEDTVSGMVEWYDDGSNDDVVGGNTEFVSGGAAKCPECDWEGLVEQLYESDRNDGAVKMKAVRLTGLRGFAGTSKEWELHNLEYFDLSEESGRLEDGGEHKIELTGTRDDLYEYFVNYCGIFDDADVWEEFDPAVK